MRTLGASPTTNPTARRRDFGAVREQSKKYVGFLGNVIHHFSREPWLTFDAPPRGALSLVTSLVAATPPNILFLLADDLGINELGF